MKLQRPTRSDIGPILRKCQQVEKKATNASALLSLMKKIKDMAKTAKQEAKSNQSAGPFIYSRKIPNLLADDLSNTQKRAFAELGVTFTNFDELSTIVTITLNSKS